MPDAALGIGGFLPLAKMAELPRQRRNMRITFVLPHAGLSGGVRVLAIYAERLRQRGHRVSVVSTPPPPDFARRLRSLLRGRGWPSSAASDPSWFDGIGVPHRVLERVRPVTDADVPDA